MTTKVVEKVKLPSEVIEEAIANAKYEDDVRFTYSLLPKIKEAESLLIEKIKEEIYNEAYDEGYNHGFDMGCMNDD